MERSCVLIIDEHEDSRIIVRTIAQYGGFEVIEARHGREALDLAAQRRPDVIVLDLELRRPAAAELLSVLQGDPALNAVPVIALSPHRDAPGPAPAGVHAVVYKPLVVATLLAELTRLASPLDA